MMARLKQARTWLALLLAGVICWFLYPVIRVGAFLMLDNPADERESFASGNKIDDASGLNSVEHAGIIKLPSDLAEAEKILVETLDRARAEKLAVVPFGARHSLGKQALREGALHVDTSGFDHLELDGDLLRAPRSATSPAHVGSD